MTSPTWDPQQYARFSGARNRAFDDLVARVGASDPGLVLDLGCGNGPLTLGLARRWPSARVVGVDLSDSMLDAARGHDAEGLAEWVRADLATWDPSSLGRPADVIVSNATLQWVPGHLSVLGRWVAGLAPGGWVAMQVPGNHDAPSHRLMREAATGHPRRDLLLAALDREPVGAPEDYLAVLAAECDVVDVWETTYLHVLDPAAEQASPVLEWVRGTGLRPLLDTLTDPSERAAYLDAYDAALRAAYPRTEHGVVLPFRRIFAVGRSRRRG